MRSIVSPSRRAVAVLLLIAILAGPTAFAEPVNDASLWAEFEAWVESGLGVSGDLTADAFMVWLMSRWGVPGG